MNAKNERGFGVVIDNCVTPKGRSFLPLFFHAYV